jgi:hypothetical protein
MNIRSRPVDPLLSDGDDLFLLFLCDELYFVMVFDTILDPSAKCLKSQACLSALPYQLILLEVPNRVFDHLLAFFFMDTG